ncbi:tRNA methyltransferase 10 homolog B-like isoform X2 [Corticium candelabrum]|nr:tRNA methyltransferase 10 homolog B-like isoform X2 [Corticium candelabrum]
MSEKELRTLSNQVREVYSSSLRAEDPFHLLFTNYSRTSLLHSLLCRTMNEDPFCLPIDMREEKVTRLFPREDIVFLTPDAVTALETLDKTKVYVLGAVADKTVKKRLTLDAAEGSGIAARRLPIKEYLHQTKPSYTATMTINQVFDILLMYQTTGDWTASLLSAIPPRKGFIARDEDRQTYNK